MSTTEQTPENTPPETAQPKTDEQLVAERQAAEQSAIVGLPRDESVPERDPEKELAEWQADVERQNAELVAANHGVAEEEQVDEKPADEPAPAQEQPPAS